MQAILGANGVIGIALSRALAGRVQLRQVSRTPRPVNAGDQVVAADLLDARATADAVAGSDVAYLVAGLRYNARVWADEWPRVMRNVIDACVRHGCRLVFLDNVYAYGLVNGTMTEQAPFNPCSRKGEVRARIAGMLLDEMRAGNVRGMIVRAADFYGPGAVQSFPHALVFERLRQGKAPQWLGNPDANHTFCYTDDVGKALATLGQVDAAYGQTWHAPASPDPMTGRAFARLASELAGAPQRLQVAPRWMLRVMGLLVPVLRENEEMMYQFDHDYRFDSGRIAATHGLQATPYGAGIAHCLAA